MKICLIFLATQANTDTTQTSTFSTPSLTFLLTVKEALWVGFHSKINKSIRARGGSYAFHFDLHNIFQNL